VNGNTFAKKFVRTGVDPRLSPARVGIHCGRRHKSDMSGVTLSGSDNFGNGQRLGGRPGKPVEPDRLVGVVLRGWGCGRGSDLPIGIQR